MWGTLTEKVASEINHNIYLMNVMNTDFMESQQLLQFLFSTQHLIKMASSPCAQSMLPPTLPPRLPSPSMQTS